ncbi:MAG: hypothetical protein Ta2E_12000 [Mycoplasmoidaceae bacterium]|nr:MAG: hypothetical protein Ta2E_12000 [Mycoplasmoidaceae bacterium]
MEKTWENLKEVQIDDIQKMLINDTKEDIVEISRNNDLKDMIDSWDAEVNKIRNEKLQKAAELPKFQRQRKFSEDAKDTEITLIKDTMPICELNLNDIHELFTNKWRRNEAVKNLDQIQRYPLKNTFDEQMKE